MSKCDVLFSGYTFFGLKASNADLASLCMCPSKRFCGGRTAAPFPLLQLVDDDDMVMDNSCRLNQVIH